MTRIRTIAHELCTNLQEQARVWSRLLELSRAQRTALEQQDVHAVHAILQEIEVTMLDRSRAELRRSMLVEQVGAELGVPSEQVTRELVASHCDAPIASALDAAATELRELVGALGEVVTRNTALLEQELSIIELMVRGATEDRSAQHTYVKSGSRSEAPRLRLLDAQV